MYVTAGTQGSVIKTSLDLVSSEQNDSPPNGIIKVLTRRCLPVHYRASKAFGSGGPLITMPQHKGCLVIKASFSCCNPWCLLGAVALRGMLLLLLLCSFFFLRELPCTCHVPRSVSKPGKGSLGLFGGWSMLVGLGT